MRKELMQVYVDPVDKKWLEDYSEKTGVPMSHIIRQAIKEYKKEIK